MTINTKYNIGNKVWIMYANKPREVEITGYQFIISNNLCSWSNYDNYCVNILPDTQMHIVKENELFSTKEELIKSL